MMLDDVLFRFKPPVPFSFFFFNDTATTEIYTLSLHDALPISSALARPDRHQPPSPAPVRLDHAGADGSRPLPADRRQAARAPARPMQRHHLPRPTLGPRHLELATATCRPGRAGRRAGRRQQSDRLPPATPRAGGLVHPRRRLAPADHRRQAAATRTPLSPDRLERPQAPGRLGAGLGPRHPRRTPVRPPACRPVAPTPPPRTRPRGPANVVLGPHRPPRAPLRRAAGSAGRLRRPTRRPHRRWPAHRLNSGKVANKNLHSWPTSNCSGRRPARQRLSAGQLKSAVTDGVTSTDSWP